MEIEKIKELHVEDLRPLKDFPTKLILSETNNFMVGKTIINGKEVEIIITNIENVIPCSLNDMGYNIDRFEKYDENRCEFSFDTSINLNHKIGCKDKKVEGSKKCILHNFELKFTDKAEEIQRGRVKEYISF